MAAIDFPNTPSVNDLFTSDGTVWKWNGTTWTIQRQPLVGPTGPTGPTGSTGGTGAAIVARNTVTGTAYTLALGDAFDLIEVDASAAFTLTVPADSSVAFSNLTEIHIAQVGTGQITVTGATGVTVQATPGRKFRAQWSAATLIKRTTDSWLLLGDLSA